MTMTFNICGAGQQITDVLKLKHNAGCPVTEIKARLEIERQQRVQAFMNRPMGQPWIAPESTHDHRADVEKILANQAAYLNATN